jgi:ribosome-associated heat shock protein Hsp15
MRGFLKPSQSVQIDDVLTFALGHHIRVIQILDPGTRRGPAPEAQALYLDLDPPKPRVKLEAKISVAQREPGAGRPTKRERREMEIFLDASIDPDDV